MKIKIINNEAYYILCDELPISLIKLFQPFSKRGEELPIIALYNGEVHLIRDNDIHYGGEVIVSLTWLVNDINQKEKVKWRSNEYRKIYLDFYQNLIKLMTSYQRDLKIDEVLRPKQDDVILWC